MYLFLFKLIVLLCCSILVGTVLIIIGTLYSSGVRLSLRSYRLLQNLPGPKGYWFIGSAIDIFNTSHENLIPQISEWFKIYPVRYALWMLGIPVVFLRDADDYQVILSNTENLRKGLLYLPLIPWLQEGLLTSDGEKWQSRRKILTPAFHFKILEDNISIFNECSRDLAKIFISKQNQEIVIEPLVSKCTLKAIMKAAMGIDLESLKLEGEKYIETVKSFSEIFTERHLNPMYVNETIFNMFPIGRRYTKCVQFLQNFSTGIISNRKNTYQNNEASVSSSGKVRKAFLDLMLEYEMKNPGALTDKGIREEVDTFMFEGHDTTSAALHFIFYSLALYQNIQEKVFAELFDIFGNSDRDITTQDLSKMRFLEKVIKESSRLYPGVPAITRFLEKDLILNDGIVIPARTDVIIFIYLLHRNEKYWSDPEKFDPERFSEENVQGRHPFSYVPFSAGPRNCIGQKFAMMELKTVVANVVRKLKIFTVTKIDEIAVVEHLVLRSVTPIKFTFTERNDK